MASYVATETVRRHSDGVATSTSTKITSTTTQAEGVEKSQDAPYVSRIRWPDLTVQLFIHIGCLYGIYLIFFSASYYTALWVLVVTYGSGFGITAGAHRLWSHRAYKAKWPLRLLLIFLFTIAGQRHVHQWALDHRVHHKFSETDADPHDARRGFLFSHVGWVVLTPHPEVVAKRAQIDMSDLEADPIVMWQKRLYVPLFAIFVIALPVWVPWYFWGETLFNSFVVMFNCRFCLTLNIAFIVNSFAHMWGNRPYEKGISPSENIFVSILAIGEGWHNYHHVFPWDYKTGEFGDYSLNLTTMFIDFFAGLGWAYERKSVPQDLVQKRVERCGDGTHALWGYGDKDMDNEDRRHLNIIKDKGQ